MSSKFKIIPLILFLILFFPNPVYAQIVINEINPSGEWVELYRSSTDPISLEGCTIYFQTTKSQKKALSSQDDFIENNLYKVILTGSNYLSNSEGDTVSMECPSFTLDPVVYEAGSMENRSFARIPNGTGGFVVTTLITMGDKNPDPTPVPTASPSPTSTPTSAPTDTPTSIPTKTASPKPTPTKTSSPRPTTTPKEVTEETTQTQSNNLADVDKVFETPVAEGKVAGASVSKKVPMLAVVFIVIGCVFLFVGGISLYKNFKSSYNGESENT